MPSPNRSRSYSSSMLVSDSEPEEFKVDASSDLSFFPSPERGRTLKRKRSPEPKRTYHHKTTRRASPHPQVSDSEGSCAASDRDASESRPPKRKLSYDTSAVPVELWMIIAGFSSRPSLASLCSVSRHFSSLFRSLLYANTVNPSLSPSQTALLLDTLATKKTAGRKPHPALLVRDLGIVDDVGPRRMSNSTKMTQTLKSIHIAQDLRSLYWTLATGVDELGKILGAPGRFPRLCEIMVSCRAADITNFNFLQIPGLEVLGVNIDFTSLTDLGWDFAPFKLCWKLAEALQMLQSSSPLLRTFRFSFKMPFYEDEFPHEAYSNVVAAINGVYLPALETLDLCMDLNPVEFYDYPFPLDFLPVTDFSPFFTSHPNLLHLNLFNPGTKLTGEDPFLLRLQSFQGSLQDAVILCARRRQLRNLVITLIQPDFPYYPLSFDVEALARHSSLTHLSVFAVDDVGKPIKRSNELSPTSFHHVVSAFPNLTHLDIVISQRMTKYHNDLSLLTSLQSLRMHEYRTRQLGPPRWPARLVFPADDYQREFQIFLPSLPHLARIEICLLADTYQYHDCLDQDSEDFDWEDFDEMCAPPKINIEYCFSVLRPASGVHVVLDFARVEDSYSESRIPTV
ncbi:hypothetical protein K438DRAFT_1865451 [Mycena galopus ATCC 62051]|nr:hypothetical protein K438DRAFT_1865451 [Mycena galopus ATCC 62051]